MVDPKRLKKKTLSQNMTKIEIKPDHHILILGKTGSGKTFTTKNVLLPALMRQRNNVIVILDPKREYQQITDNVVNNPHELNHFLYAGDKPQGSVVRALINKPSEAMAEEYLSASWSPFADLTGDSYYQPTFGVRFFIEDMPIFYDSPYQTPENLKQWVTMGRALNRTIVGTSQRAQLIPKTVMTMCEHLFIFRLAEYDIHQVIKVYHGHEASVKVATLEQYGYVLVSDLYEKPIKFKPYQPKVKPKEEKGVEL